MKPLDGWDTARPSGLGVCNRLYTRIRGGGDFDAGYFTRDHTEAINRPADDRDGRMLAPNPKERSILKCHHHWRTMGSWSPWRGTGGGQEI